MVTTVPDEGRKRALGPSGAWAVAATVTDPELPTLTLADLGVLRDVRIDDHGRVVVELTPTYTGCPAMGVMRADLV
ncbi:MAG: metal-sulfur cluster assembly factor, partial [Actinomycetes bacterium]